MSEETMMTSIQDLKAAERVQSEQQAYYNNQVQAQQQQQANPPMHPQSQQGNQMRFSQAPQQQFNTQYQPGNQSMAQMHQPSQGMYYQNGNSFQPTFDPSIDVNGIQMKDTAVLFVIGVILFSTPIQDIVCRLIPSICSNGRVCVNMAGVILLSFLTSLFFSTYKLYG